MIDQPVDEQRTPAQEDEEEGPIGIFPSWSAIYVTVLVFTFLLILILYWFTVSLDFHA